MPDRPLLIVDGDNMAHRAYHSMPKSTVASDGAPVNAIVGFFSMLARVFREEQPRGVFVAWDTLGVDTYRNRLWPAYQTGRVFEEAIVRQLDQLPTLCRSFAMGTGKAEGYEADDVMASAAVKEVEQGGSVLLFTTDRDSYQLVRDEVTVISPQRGTKDLARIGPREVVERLGVLPEQVPDFKALAGDSSDKIPGIAGIGPKSASALLLRHGSLEEVIADWAPADAQRALMFREVVTMRKDLPVELPAGPPDWEAGTEALRRIGIERKVV
jgi:DNA polymerase I